MASWAKRLPGNVEGDFYVDSTCIDCAACRWIAPASFAAEGEVSVVAKQPASAHELRRAEMAILACPVGCIGSRQKRSLRAAQEAFPDPIAANVYHCGYHSEDSFGAASYLIVRPGGNVLVDSPRFTKPLVRRLEELGGVQTLFLTHQDDVADHARFREHFGCERILHRDDVGSDTRGVERLVEGADAIVLDDDLTMLPVPGHTRGSMCLLYRDTFLFSGDHAAYSPELAQIYAFRAACWYSWAELQHSMERLAAYRFEWMLPGHGHPCHFDADRMRAEMARCLSWMRSVG
jgi:glyoxylase-like metal-dependent hydrolase (beta-lactamase superfamily II)/ferredoxin